MSIFKSGYKLGIGSRSTLLARTYQPYHFHYLIWFLLAAVFSVGLFYVSRRNYLVFHSFVDLSSVVVACSVFLIIFNSYRFLSNHYFLIIGTSFVSAALIDFLHVITYRGMNVLQMSAAESTNIATQLWVADRILISISFVIAPLFLRRRIRGRYVLASHALVTAILLASIFYFKNFPTAYDADTGLTFFKKSAEYFTTFLFVAAGIHLYAKRRFVDRVIFRLLLLSIMLTVLSGISFVLYVDVYGFYNFAGHMFRLFSFYLVYRAIIVTSLISPYDILFWDLKQSEKQLRAQTEQLQREKDEEGALLSSLKDGIIAVDKSGRVLFTNKPLIELLGLKKDKIRGEHQESLIKIYDSKDRLVPFSQRPLGRVLSSSSVSSVQSESYYVRKGKRKIYVSIVATPVVSNKKVIGAIALYRDMTKEREMEKSKSDFIAFAAHQLRSPLTAASLAAEVISAEPLSDAAKARLEDIHHEIHRMSDTIRKLLNISRIEMGLWPVKPEKVIITDAIDHLLSGFKSMMEMKSIRLERSYDGNLPLVETDPTLLQIVLDNLVSNAVKYTESGGLIRVEVEGTVNEIVIEVADTGKGIPEEQQHRIFDKMFRANNVARSEGTGLGLYMTKFVVEQIGGRIWFESKTSEGGNATGTSFFVTIPVSTNFDNNAFSGVKCANKTKSISN